MDRRAFLVGMGGLAGWPLAAEAQQAGKVYRIGYLSLAVGLTPRFESLLRGLRELGWVEGQNIVIERRYAKGDRDRLTALAAELVRAKVDVVFAAGTEPTVAAKNATQTIPIVFVAVDPVERGFVATLGRPQTNMTPSLLLRADQVIDP